MIDFYTAGTPNGYKPAIMLEEIGLPYSIHKVDISKGDQFSPEYIEINPNSKIPAIIDREADISVFESGAVLIYLAEKTGKLLPTDPAERALVMGWLMFQMASVGPMFGQFGHFRNAAPEKIPYAIERYQKEATRLLKVLEHQLAKTTYMAGDYSIADIATYPWVFGATGPYLEVSLDDCPNIQRWMGAMQARPAVKTGMSLFSPEFDSKLGAIA